MTALDYDSTNVNFDGRGMSVSELVEQIDAGARYQIYHKGQLPSPIGGSQLLDDLRGHSLDVVGLRVHRVVVDRRFTMAGAE